MRKAVPFKSEAENRFPRLLSSVKRLLQTVVFVGVAGCSSTTAPVTPFTVTLPPQVTRTGRSVLLNGATVYQCDFPITITTTGGGTGKDEQYLLMGNGTLTTRRESDGLTATIYGALNRETFFGSTTLNSGQTATGTLVVQRAGGAFTGMLEFTYSILPKNAGESSLPNEDRGFVIALTCQ